MPKLPNSLSAARPGPEQNPLPPSQPSQWGPPARRALPGQGWDAEPNRSAAPPRQDEDASPTARLLALFAEPRIHTLDAASAAAQLDLPRQDVANMLSALAQAGFLERHGELEDHFALTREKKQELEQLYIHTLREVHQETGLVAPDQAAALELQAQEDDPRMPMTAGILSLFLPGTGQLLNGDIGRAVLVFAIWALAILTPHPAIIIFVRLYAGAEAFFNAKLRRLAQRRALEAAAEKRAALGPASPALPAPGVGS